MNTVGTLKELLNDYPDHLKVILSKDGEGNSYSPLAPKGYTESYGIYIPDNTWSGEFTTYKDDEQSYSIEESNAFVFMADQLKNKCQIIHTKKGKS